MRRREFLATMGTAAAISSAFQAFAQPGVENPQKVMSPITSRSKPSPEKKRRSPSFCARARHGSRPNLRRLPGSAFVSDPQPSPFSTRFPMKQAGKRICPGK
jgi:hypothetical protein